MSDSYYLHHYSSRKVDTYTYEYDNWKDSLSGDRKYYVDIIFENGEFERLDFGDKARKSFDNNLKTKELDLFNKIQEEIEKIKEMIYKDK